ncbi:hypothetical protein BHE74_00030558 [Ensete ventricosum]|nr:hypothetical protein BHE74_00030558 [Ensete ventricosum]RZR87727.1 hypothetical protein BHM03_00015186 [Ensete ventricosum]
MLLDVDGDDQKASSLWMAKTKAFRFKARMQKDMVDMTMGFDDLGQRGGEKKDEIGRVTKVLRAAAVDQGDRSEMKKAGFFAASLAAAYLAAASSAALADASPDPQASSFSSKEVRLSSPSPPGS